LTARLEALEEDEYDEPDFHELRFQIFSEALQAYVKREAALNQRDLQEKGVKSFSISAEMHMEWESDYRRERDPPLNIKACGILALRRFLAELPVQQNYQRYLDHFFTRLPHLLVTAGLVFEMYEEDEGYALMRQDLDRQIPMLKATLDNAIKSQLELMIATPWVKNETERIDQDIREHVCGSWKQPGIYWAGFQKMLRENGIPVNGKYYGHNLNDELLAKFFAEIERWFNTMLSRVEQLAQHLNTFVRKFTARIEDSINRSSAEAALKERAIEALRYSSEQTQKAYSTLVLQLRQTLIGNYRHFTTEEDIYCPIAKEMKPVYEHAQTIEQGSGVYERSRVEILKLILPKEPGRGTKGHGPTYPVLENIRSQVVDRQKDAWNASCNTFTAAAIKNLEEFAHTSEQLLKNAAYMTEQHREARVELQKLLVGFNTKLENLQGHFTTREEGRAGKRVKHEPTNDAPSAQASASTPEPDPQSAMVVRRPAPVAARQSRFWLGWW